MKTLDRIMIFVCIVWASALWLYFISALNIDWFIRCLTICGGMTITFFIGFIVGKKLSCKN